MHRDQIDAVLAGRLIAEQFPRWSGLPVVPVDVDGWDNRTFRLGDTMSVRLPSAEAYVPAVEKEDRWLPRLASQLPLAIPEPVASGRPSEEYPWPWSVRRWLPGRAASRNVIRDPALFASDLAGFLVALQGVDPVGGPSAGSHSFYRGAKLDIYDEQTREAIAVLARRINAGRAIEVWEAALAASWSGSSVWFHGDVSANNLLLDDSGRLCAVIDFGTCGVGDPACDLVIAWTLLEGDGRTAFRERMAADGAVWERARGWALWKALITAATPGTSPSVAVSAENVVREVLAEHVGSC
jgi:aminoglycoside phosphotransferase (APT) family kinase protein